MTRRQHTMEPMDWEYDSFFRFLDLPPELRNLTYQSYLDDENQDHQLDIIQWKQLAPSPAITAVSKQVRSESLGYFCSAFSDYFQNHFWALHLDASLRHDHVREHMLFALHSVPKMAQIRELQFSIKSFRCSRRGWPIPVIISVSINEDGKVQWNFRALNNPNPFAIILIRAWLVRLNARAESYGIMLTHGPKADFINVGNCVQVFMGKMHKDDAFFEDLSMFFVA